MLTDAQRKKIEAILEDYRTKTTAIVTECKKDVYKILSDLDAKKMEEIRKALGPKDR